MRLFSARNAATAALLLFSGVLFGARPGALEAQELSRLMADRNAPVYQVGENRWIALADLAFVLDGTCDYRAGGHRVELSFRGNRMIFVLGSRTALFNDREVEMPLPARRISGLPAIPFAFAEQVSRPGFTPGTAAAPERPADRAEDLPDIFQLLTGALHPGLEETIAEAIHEAPRILVIDPGHGGRDAGAIGPQGLTEKAVVLDISLRLRDYLKSRRPGLEIVMTRDSDVFVPLERRVQLSNEAQADLFISIHANDARLNRHTANGFETFYPAGKPRLAAAGRGGQPAASLAWASPLEPVRAIEKSRYLAELVQEELSDVYIESIPDRGVKRRNFFVLRDTMMPSVLVEVGFISNPLIEANLRQPKVRQAIAEALGRGIEGYIDLRPTREKAGTDPQEELVPPPPGH